MKDNGEILVTSEEAHVDILLQEFKQAGVMPNGFYDVAANQEARRCIWAGQSPDGRKWDENMPEGQVAMPWNGSADTRVPMVDGVVNDAVAVEYVAFKRAELRASAVDPDRAELAAEVSKHLHWMVHTRYRRPLEMECQLASQYVGEHGFCVAYVGWEREVAKRRVKLSMQMLSAITAPASSQGGDQSLLTSSPTGENERRDASPTLGEDQSLLTSSPTMGGEGGLMALFGDPEREDEAVGVFQELYRVYVSQELAAKGFFQDELEDEGIVTISAPAAQKCVKELREEGETKVPMAYACKNAPVVWVGQPYTEILCSRGTMELQRSRAVFWRRWMTEADIRAKAAEGWDGRWIEEAVKTKGNISSWSGALGATSLSGPSTKTVGNTTYLKVTEENNPLIEVVYCFVKKVDGDGVTGIWQTIMSPHLTKDPVTNVGDFCAKHELVDYAHGRYPFVERKREHLGRALTDTRSVAEVASTWQNEEKKQRDMLFNRADWDTLPPVQVPKLGGVDYRLGPGAQLPVGRGQDLKAVNLGAPPAALSLELVQQINLRKKEYFGQPDATLDPGLTGAKQQMQVGGAYDFWGEVLLQMFALTLQYNPMEIARVTGNPELVQSLDPGTVLDEFDFGFEFDVRELNPDFLETKMRALHEMVLPADAGGVIDRAALTGLELGMIDPRLKQRLVQDKGAAAQKIYDDVDLQMMRMATGNEAKYVENDPSAPMRLQYLKMIVQNNPKYQQWLGPQGDPRFKALLQNYVKNLQMSVDQEENKQVGRIGVKALSGSTAAPSGAATMGMGM